MLILSGQIPQYEAIVRNAAFAADKWAHFQPESWNETYPSNIYFVISILTTTINMQNPPELSF